MSERYFAFGEILWDCLPSGRHAGGAPFNVTAHLAQLGGEAALISAVGRDKLGDEILQVAHDKKVGTQYVTRARVGLTTGTVLVTLDANSNATYELVQPAAWDEIVVPERAVADVAGAQAFIYGSLAGRSLYNLEQVQRLLTVAGPTKIFDANLRPPFADPVTILDLAEHASVVKLNEDELGSLANYLRIGSTAAQPLANVADIAAACAALAEATGVSQICVTRGAQGAAFWNAGEVTCASAPPITVRDTVGAGDAFMAGLTVGLTRGMEIPKMLASACRLGGFVASHHGATPLLPPEIIAEFT